MKLFLSELERLGLLLLLAFIMPAQLDGAIRAAPSQLAVAEGGGTATYTLSLSSAPTAVVRITLEGGPEIRLNGQAAGASVNLEFSPVNWAVPRNLIVAAVDDLITECTEYFRINHTVRSADPAYNNLPVADLPLKVLDNDSLPAVSDLPTLTQLPDPFLMNNGRRVSTAGEWRERREEIKGILQYYEYGFMAGAPVRWSISPISSKAWFSGKAYRYNLNLWATASNSISMGVNVYLPAKAGPFPVVLNVGDDASKAAICMPRGYALVTYDYESLDPDTEGYDVVGPAQAAFPEYDWGSLCVWAWGASRVMDYLQTRSDMDVKRVIIRGHSRGGKVALIAGAFDERFAMTAPNGAGAGGPSVYRIRSSGSESLASITSPKRFSSWFQTNFKAFAYKETKLPFDQHFLEALVAPRPLLTTDAIEDLWANPKGNQASREAAARVYRALGASGNIGMHFRPGGHENLDEDWSAMLDYADLHFFGTPFTTDFDYRPDPSYTPGYTWTAPDLYPSGDISKDMKIDARDPKQ